MIPEVILPSQKQHDITMFFSKRKFSRQVLSTVWFIILTTVLAGINRLHAEETDQDDLIRSRKWPSEAHSLYKKGCYGNALESYFLFIQEFPSADGIAEALFWMARSCEKMENFCMAEKLREKLINEYPQSPWSAEAYVRCFNHAQYVQGDRLALKHLSELPVLFPESALGIYAHLILGLHAEKHSREDPHRALSEFSKVEQSWWHLKAEGKIPKEFEESYRELYANARLGRSRMLLFLARSSQGNQRNILIKSASELLENLFSTSLGLEARHLSAKVYKLQGDINKAKEIWEWIISHSESEPMVADGTMADVYNSLGKIMLSENRASTALEFFKKSEGFRKTETPELLDLWLSEALCLRSLKCHTEALTVLSKVINSHLASVERIKAMCLRAEVYVDQGNQPLAIKQLQSIIQKGGKWKAYVQSRLETLNRNNLADYGTP